MIKQLKSKKQRMPESQVGQVFGQVANGVRYMQSIGVMHRDLKLGNILITHKESRIKIIDFGLAVKLEVGEKGE